MKRRRFLQNSLGFGFFALPALRRSNQHDSKKLSVPEDDAESSKHSSVDLQSVISRGDIRRVEPPSTGSQWVVLYQGNGRFGSCFGPWGLHSKEKEKKSYTLQGSTRLTHLKHYTRGKFNGDYLLPLANIYWETEPESVINYSQHQSFYDGTVTTQFSTADYTIKVISWFDTVEKDVAGLQIEVNGKVPPVMISTPRKFSLIYDQQMEALVEEKLQQGEYKASIRCLDAHSTLKVVSDAEMTQGRGVLELHLRQGLNSILIGVNNELDISATNSLSQTKKWWHEAWNKSGWLDLPDQRAQQVWVRSLAYTLYSHNDDGFGCSPPTGLAGNGWPFPFPFDSACRHPLLLMTGQTEVARKWVEFWHSHLEGLKDYTLRFFKGEGIFLPHVFPYGDAYHYHYPQPPNKYYYPIYNSSLMVRVADQTAVMVDDPAWTKKYAEPLIHEAAKFYLSHLKKGEDGFWHLHIVPSISLDESGSVDQPDYVSGLISAQYSLQKAVEYGLDKDERMRQILRDGFAFKSLLAENGMYHNHRDPAIKDFGRQKHPDQLFPLVHTPLGPSLDEAHKRAYELRYDTTQGAKEPRFIGHTLGEFILAGARMHDRAGWLKDWGQILPAKYMDAEMIQFYESTGNSLVFYITTHGLFAQALLETTVSTWWNRLDLCSCIPWDGRVRFGNIRTLLGVTVSGEIKDGIGRATLHAWKDTTFKYKDRNISLKKGGEMKVKLIRNDRSSNSL